MKITFEITDALMKRVKLRAVKLSQKLNEAIIQLPEIGMVATSEAEEPPRAPEPLRLRGGALLTFRDIDSAIESGRG